MSSSTPVVSKKSGEPFDVYIGRGSQWGNPFPMRNQTDAERRRVIMAYETHLLNSPGLLAQVSQLHGKRLACFCAPKDCHGDVLAHYADAVSLTGRLPSTTASHELGYR